jgi:hypothetical protein
MESEILITAMRKIGFETFLPCRRFGRILLTMNDSKNNVLK